MNDKEYEVLHSALTEGSVKINLARDYIERFQIQDMRLISPLVDINGIFHTLLEHFFDGECPCKK